MSLEAEVAALTAAFGDLSARIAALQRELDVRLPPAPMPPTPTRAEAARSLRVCVDTVDTMVRDGRLHAIRIGRSVRIDPASLRALLPADDAEVAALAREARR